MSGRGEDLGGFDRQRKQQNKPQEGRAAARNVKQIPHSLRREAVLWLEVGVNGLLAGHGSGRALKGLEDLLQNLEPPCRPWRVVG